MQELEVLKEDYKLHQRYQRAGKAQVENSLNLYIITMLLRLRAISWKQIIISK